MSAGAHGCESRWTAGGQRSGSNQDSGGCLLRFGALIVISLVFYGLAWLVSTVGHAIDLTPTFG